MEFLGDFFNCAWKKIKHLKLLDEISFNFILFANF
jgi:hypothetical protein